MKRTLSLSALTLGLVLAIPQTSAACYDKCVGAPGCRTCETGSDLTFQVCVVTPPCKCHTYFVPSYQCTGLTAGGTSSSVSVFAVNATAAAPEPGDDLGFLVTAP
ncbi:MAG TPA: hypothetical protein VGS22_28835 [Thermoanaerobaculia bacterium]|jgi:hypothetical protein|nr:hypothetical protein [Thermoanaerobaculia bacterium]